MTETKRIQLFLSGMQNRIPGPYLAAIYRIIILLMAAACRQDAPDADGLQEAVGFRV
jgi:hypothetical protein